MVSALGPWSGFCLRSWDLSIGSSDIRRFKMEGGATNTIASVTTAITNMATSVADNSLGMIAAILPVLAPVVAAVIIAKLGYKLVKKFGG